MLIPVIILAFVQGLTEFLPVSSSGHLVLLSKLFGISNDFLLLSVLLHVATLFSVIFVMKDEIKELIKNPYGKMGKNLIIATLPTVIIVLLFKGVFDKSFSGAYLPICFMLTAFLIVLTEILKRYQKNDKSITKKISVFMGIAQGIAVFPGISRSGATICTGLISRGKKDEVANFSFLMSIPIIIASLILEIYEYVSSGQAIVLAWYELLVGFIVAFIVGLFAVKFMLKIIKKHSLIWFAIYLIFISVISFMVI